MSNPRRIIWLLVVAVCLAAAYYYNTTLEQDNDSARTKTTRIALFAAHGDPFWDIVITGARKAAAEFNADLDINVPSEGDEGATDQTKQLVSLNLNEFDGIAVSPREPERQTRLISSIASQIFVTTLDNDAPQSLRHCYVGTNNRSAGTLAVELIQRALPDGGKLALFVGDNDRQNARDRREALIAALSGKEDAPEAAGTDVSQPIEAGTYIIVGTYLDGGDPEIALANVGKALEEHPDLECLVALYGYNGPACLKGLENTNKLGEVKLVTFDEHEATLRGVADGHIVGTVVQDPFRYGYEAVRQLTLLHNDTEFAMPIRGASAADILLPCSIVDQSSVEKYRQQLESRITQ